MALIGLHDYFISHNYTLPELNNLTQAKEIADYKAAEADYLATVKSATTDNPKIDEIKAE